MKQHRQMGRIGFTLVELLVVIAIIGVLVALLLPAVQAARESARRTQCISNLKQLALGLLNYESSRGVLPAALEYDEETQTPNTTSQPGINWAIALLPQIEQGALHDQFDFTMPISRGPINERARSQSLAVMLCPSDERNRDPMNGGAAIGDSWARGNYGANVGNGPTIKNYKNGIWGPESEGWQNEKIRGVLGLNYKMPLERITDGLSNTMMLGELRAGLTARDRRGIWALGTAGASIAVFHGWGGDANGPNACLPNADDVSGCENSLQAQYQAECMSCFSGDQWNDQAAIRSVHPGGVQIAMTDGSARFINNFVETSGQCCSPWDRFILSADGLVGDQID